MRRGASTPRHLGTAAIVVALAAGLGLRIWIALVEARDPGLGRGGLGPDGDRHRARAPERVPVGAHYGGTQEVFLLAPVLLVTGASVVALRVVQALLYAAAAVLVGGSGAARSANRRRASPPSSSGSGPLTSYGVRRASTASTAVRSSSRSQPLAVMRLYERRRALDLVLLGLTLGLGWWATPQCAFVAVPAALWLAARRPRLLRDLPIVLGGRGRRGTPVARVERPEPLGSFQALPAGNSYTGRLVEFFASTLPTMLGCASLGRSRGSRARWSGARLTAAVIGLVLWLAIRRRNERLEPLLVVALAFPFSTRCLPTPGS